MKKYFINIILLLIIGCSDNSQPIILISYPLDGDTISGIVEIIVEIDTYLEVIKVEYYVDEILITTLSEDPFYWMWDTTEYLDTLHTLKAYAYTSNGSVGISDIIEVTVDQSSIE